MPLTTNIKNRILKSLVAKDTCFGSSVYLGLSSTEPTAAGTNITEPSGNGYARVLVGNTSQTLTSLFGDPSNGTITNKDIIYFPEATGSWGDTLTHYVLYTSATGTGSSYVLAYGQLKNNGVASPITVSQEGTVVMFRAGAFEINYIEANNE